MTILGDTIRLNAVFTALESTATDPTTPTITIYDGMHNILVSGTTASGVTSSASAGYWYYDYTPPFSGTYFYSFQGTVGGYVVKNMGSFYVSFG